MANNNRTEAKTATDTNLVATLDLAQHRAYLKDEVLNGVTFDKDVIDDETPVGSALTVDFSNKDLARATVTVNTAVTFTGMQNGMVKYLVITKQQANVITFSGAIDATKNARQIGFMTSIVYRISNKNGLIYVEGLTPDFTIPIPNTTIVEIGIWDMVTNRTLTVNINLDSTKIRKIFVWIQDDSGEYCAPLNGYDYSSPDFRIHGGIGFHRNSTNNLLLYRNDSGWFNQSLYSGVGNRGWITIEHID